jgi:hypothetical protein
MIKKIKILILTLLFAVPGIFAQTVEIEELSAQAAGPKTLGLSMNDFTGASGNVSAATFLISINPDLLVFNGISNQYYPGNITANFNTNNNILTINYTLSAGQTIDGKLIDMDFTYLGGAVAHLIFETTQCEIKNSSQQTITASYENGFVSPVSTDQMVVLEQKFAQYPGPVTIGLSMLKFEGLAYGPVGSITLRINYNTSLLTFNGYSNLDPDVSDIDVNFDNNDKTLKINYSSTVGFEIDGKLMDLNFTYSGGTPAPLLFNTGQCEIAKAGNLGVVPTTFTDGLVSNTNTGIVGQLSVGSGNALINSIITLPVQIESFDPNWLTSVNSISLRIGYDHTKLQYVGTSDNSLFVENGFEPGTISFGWESTAAQNMSGPETLFNLKFRVIGTGGSEVGFLPGTVVTTGTVPEYIAFAGGDVYGGNARVKVFLEGFYDTGTGEMRKAQKLDGAVLVDNFAGTIADEITIELHDAANAYGSNPIEFPGVNLNQDGYAYFVTSGLTATTYYLTVKHRNHLETVSATSLNFSLSGVTYDFTTAAGQAYGNNQKALSDGNYAIFAGDISGPSGFQDGEIDIIDRGVVIFAIGNEGYLVNDLDATGEVDIIDRGIVIDNIGEQAQTP